MGRCRYKSKQFLNTIIQCIFGYICFRVFRRRLKQQKLANKRKFHVHLLNTPDIRRAQGDYENLLKAMRENDVKKFFNHLRVTPQLFDELLLKIGDKIVKQDFIRETIPAEIRLAMTLR